MRTLVSLGVPLLLAIISAATAHQQRSSVRESLLIQPAVKAERRSLLAKTELSAKLAPKPAPKPVPKPAPKPSPPHVTACSPGTGAGAASCTLVGQDLLPQVTCSYGSTGGNTCFSGKNKTWHFVATSGSGRVVIAAEDGGEWFDSNSTGQVFISHDSGLNWKVETALPHAKWASVASSFDGSHLAAAAYFNKTQRSLYTSTDSGLTWTASTAPSTQGWLSVTMSSDGSRLFATEGYRTLEDPSVVNQIYTSRDGGLSWEVSNAGFAHWRALACSANGSTVVAAQATRAEGDYGFLYTSPNAGASWSVGAGAPIGNWGRVASSADGTRLIAALISHYSLETNKSSIGGLYTSHDSGVTWNASVGAAPGAWLSVASSADGMHLFAAMEYNADYTKLGQFFVSNDAGTTWTATGVPYGYSSVASSSDGKHLFVAQLYDQNPLWSTGGQFYKSSDSGKSWGILDV